MQPLRKICEQQNAQDKDEEKVAMNAEAVYFLIMFLTHNALYEATRVSKTNAKTMWQSINAEYHPKLKNLVVDLEEAWMSIRMPPDQEPQIMYDQMQKINALLAEQHSAKTEKEIITTFVARLPSEYEHIKFITETRKDAIHKAAIVAACNHHWRKIYPDQAVIHSTASRFN